MTTDNIGKPGNRKGAKHTEEAKAKMSVAKHGKSSYMKGKTHTEEAKAKMSVAKRGKPSSMKGRSHTEETKARMSTMRRGKPGKPHTEETKARMSTMAKERFSDPEEMQKFLENGEKGRFTKGQVAHNKGMPMPEEQKTKMRLLRPSEESIAKMAETKRGQKLSEEHKQKISDRLRGRECSDETRAKIAASQKGIKHPPERIAKMAASKRGKSSHMKGKTHTEKTRKRLSEIGKQRDHPRGYKHDEAFSARRSEINRERWKNISEDERRAHLDKLHEGGRNITNSSIEDAYARGLDVDGIVYERQKRIGWYRVDFYIPAENHVIEVQGCYWHCCEQCGYADAFAGKRESDDNRYNYLISKGYKVTLVWEHDLPRKRS